MFKSMNEGEHVKKQIMTEEIRGDRKRIPERSLKNTKLPGENRRCGSTETFSKGGRND